jgi:dTDP-4-amino-4,6-dideoxygalactose transaminase
MRELEELAARRGVLVIEDAAQGLGAHNGGRPVGSLGRASCLSFDPTKVVGSFSSAGAVVTDDPEVARRVAMQRYHGRDPDTREYEMLGYNSQLSSEMAAMLVFKLSKMPEWANERATVAATYREGLEELSEHVTLPFVHEGRSHNWHKFVIRAADRDRLIQHLKKAGVQAMVHYPNALCDTPLFVGYAQDSDVPEARRATRTVLSLPIYAELSRFEAEAVVAAIREYYGQ